MTTMHLHKGPFERVKSGVKKVEVRLYDEKRRGLSVGDEVTFVSRENPEDTIVRTITDLKVFSTFEDVYAVYPEERDENIYQYYSKEDEEKFGVLVVSLI